jgi:hypothetical protein
MVSVQNPRSEDIVFAELQALAAEPGYAHAIAALCFRDNTIRADEEVNADDLAKMYSPERLVRTEISTLIGLLVKNELNIKLPPPDQLQRMLDRSEQLLLELHKAMVAPTSKIISNAMMQKESSNPFTRGDVLREAIFYCGESAYGFQFREFAKEKYSADNDWLIANRGFSIQDAITVVRSISNIQNDTVMRNLESLFDKEPNEWTMLPGYIFTADQVKEATQLDPLVVVNVLDAFTLPSTEHNQSFNSVSDYNTTNAYPIIQISEAKFILFQNYSLVEALYESPFYWMGQDQEYATEAAKNRGSFTERFCADRMRSIFGEHRVHENVILRRGKKTIVGEIDTLVLFGNRAVIIQAKSKRMTIEARKGNDSQLKDDFKLAIQDSYNQGLSCAKAIQEEEIVVLDKESQVIETPHQLKEIYIFCVLSEHYPALAFQARQLINIERTEKIKPPFVMDIFLLDTMVEMLPSPLHFISYINRRTEYDDKVLAGHEHTVLSYHLKRNLWIEPEFGLFILNDDISADLDIAMMARRDGFPGKPTPDGILTRISDTKVGEIIRQIENTDDSLLVDFGFLLLALREDTLFELSNGIEAVISLAVDFSNHDVTIVLSDAETGITVHSNCDSIEIAMERLDDHCKRRKYSHKAQTWFGLCLEPRTAAIRFSLNFDFPWKQSREMDDAVANFSKEQNKINLTTSVKPRKKKAGRNDPCPCGSGRKYKECCLYRIY